MRKEMFRVPIATLTALASGLVVLLSYALPDVLGSVRNMIFSWVYFVSAGALLLGALNLLATHLGKIRRIENPVYSLVLIVSMGITFGVTLISGPGQGMAMWIFRYVHFPIEASLMAVLSVTLTFAAARMLSQRMNAYSIIFIGAVLLTLLGAGPFLTIEVPWISDWVYGWMITVLASGGARGILLGVALGTITAGLRVLMGAERPYGG